MRLAPLRRVVVLLAVLAIAAGQLVPAFAATHRAADPAMDMTMAVANAAADECDGCAGTGPAADCQAICGLAAILATPSETRPAVFATVAIAPDRRAPGRCAPPDPYPPKAVLPV